MSEQKFVELLEIGDSPKMHLIPLTSINIITVFYAPYHKDIKILTIYLNDQSARTYSSDKTKCSLYDKLP